jgi:hypothetical protein
MVSPFTGPKIAPRIQFNIDTKVPICGEYPSRGPKTFGPGSGPVCSASAAGEPVASNAVAPLRPQTNKLELLRKLLRSISIFVLISVPIMHLFACVGTTEIFLALLSHGGALLDRLGAAFRIGVWLWRIDLRSAGSDEPVDERIIVFGAIPGADVLSQPPFKRKTSFFQSAG